MFSPISSSHLDSYEVTYVSFPHVFYFWFFEIACLAFIVYLLITYFLSFKFFFDLQFSLFYALLFLFILFTLWLFFFFNLKFQTRILKNSVFIKFCHYIQLCMLLYSYCIFSPAKGDHVQWLTKPKWCPSPVSIWCSPLWLIC